MIKASKMKPDSNPALTSSSVKTQNLNLGQNTPWTQEDPTKCQSEVLAVAELNQSADQVHTNMNPVNPSAPSPGSEVPNAPKDHNPDQKKSQTDEGSPTQVNDSTQGPCSVPLEVSYPVQIQNFEPNKTIVLTKPPVTTDQGPSQSIVVRVPAMALLKALVKNTGQAHVRIPLQTQSPGSVLVPSTAASNIHLTASVQSLTQHPGIVKNRVQCSSIVISPVNNPCPVPTPVRSPNAAQKPMVAAPVWMPAPNPSQIRTPVNNLVQRMTPVSNSTQTTTSVPNPVPFKSPVTAQDQDPGKDQCARCSPNPDSGLDLDLVRVPLPPQAVRALSPPLKTTPLKPSVPPLGFRLNGKLIRLLPGMEGLEASLRTHPSGSRCSLTSVRLTKTPPPAVFPDVPRPSIRLPRPSATAPRELLQKKLPRPPPVKAQNTQPPPKPKPRPHVIIPKPHLEKPKASLAAALIQKGKVIQRRPPDCTVCVGQFKPVPELRGFACMCSSDIASALQILKLRRKDERVKSRLKKKLNLLNQQQKVSKPQPFHSHAASKSLCSLQKPLRASEHTIPEPRPSMSPSVPWPRRSVSPGLVGSSSSVSPGVTRPHPSPSSAALERSEISSPCSGAEVTVGGAVGRLVIHLEDFYYGSAEGEWAVEQVRLITTYRCVHCSQVLTNNVSVMQHTRDHMSERFRRHCSHCFRQFFSPLKLKRHLDVVHGPDSCSSRVVCRICELEFENEVVLLLHMKELHKPGEMPYACGLCGFRSSFFSQTWRHFEEVHADTRHFMCHFCLRIFKMDHTYQKHVARHLKKHVYSCHKCRLHFHVAKDRQDHQEQHHGTHVRPAQLSGLRPGTMVSVRTFQVASPECPVKSEASAALTKVATVVPLKQQKAYKRKAVESLGQILSQLHSSECGRCVECLSQFQDFSHHFPTRVTCSRCHFQTCCSRAYANHMINNHSDERSHPRYPQVFTSYPRSNSSLECLICGFFCQSGDVMALHLSKNPKHTCLLTDGAEEMSDYEDDQSSVWGRGGFVSIQNLNSPQLSITTLDQPTHLSSPAAMTVTVRSPSLPLPKPAAPLTVSRLLSLLHSLLYGFASASKHFGVSQYLISRWAREQRKSLTNRRWRWDSTSGARWVLTEREQNRIVTHDAILDLSCRTLGPNTPLQARLNWAVDFLLRHDLGVETRSKELREIGYSVVTSTWDKVTSLLLVPSRFCCMDEFPVFMDTEALSSLAPDALRVWGHGEELPLVEVLLCGTSDGSLLPPMLFYNKSLPSLPCGFPTNVILQASEEGYSPREKAQLWADKVWLPHLKDITPSLILLDEHCGHMTPDFQEPLQQLNTKLVYIPQGCSFLVQPLDQCVAPVVRKFLRVRWSQLVSQSPVFNESDLVLTLACWFSEVCHILNTNNDFIHRSFLCVGTRYKTTEVAHHSLNQALHQALIQTLPQVSTVSQSEDAKAGEEGGTKTEDQSEGSQEQKKMENNLLESPTETEEMGSQKEACSNLQEEIMEVDQSETQEEAQSNEILKVFGESD